MKTSEGQKKDFDFEIPHDKFLHMPLQKIMSFYFYKMDGSAKVDI